MSEQQATPENTNNSHGGFSLGVLVLIVFIVFLVFTLFLSKGTEDSGLEVHTEDEMVVVKPDSPTDSPTDEFEPLENEDATTPEEIDDSVINELDSLMNSVEDEPSLDDL